jgi:hypothetical protein
MLTCKNASLSHVSRFDHNAAQEQAAKAAKTKGGSTPCKPSVSKPPISNILWALPTLKGTNIPSGSNPSSADQKVDNKPKGTMGTEDKEVLVEPSNPYMKNRNLQSSLFSGTILMFSHVRYQICPRSLGR